MKYGAPAHLLNDAVTAAQDEIRHAQACFLLASRFDPQGRQFVPGNFPIGTNVEIAESMEEMVTKLAYEGCWGEVLGTLLAARQFRTIKDAQVGEILKTIIV